MPSTRPPGPVAFLYCSVRYLDRAQRCSRCSSEWSHQDGDVAMCPDCGHQQAAVVAHSIEGQRERLVNYCRARWSDGERPTMVAVSETLSGPMQPFDQREQSSKVFALVERGDYFITCRLDRAWQSAFDFSKTFVDMQQRGVTVIVVETGLDTGDEMMAEAMGICAALVNLDRTTASVETAAGIKARRDRGLYTGNHLKFGSRMMVCQKTGKKIVVDDINELRMAKWVYIMRFKKRVPWNVLTVEAEKLGFLNRAGKPFSLQKLKDMGTDARRLKASGKLARVQ